MKKTMLLAIALFAAGGAAAQRYYLETPIPVDKELRTGRLDNGMTYYIRHNEKPKGQADFYILHDVGAIQEEDDQQGLAHFLEHMAFNGTKNMPGKQMIEYLETIGVKFGYNLNAATSWDHTVYNISNVPTSRKEIVDSALLVLHDWSHFIALQPEEIDSERGVIMEELRTRDGAAWRSTMKLIQALGKDTKYEHRNLIGYLEDLKSFEHDALERFYKMWYRPDYQAVIIVGDIDPDEVEKSLKRMMADIPAPAQDAPEKQVVEVPENKEPIVSIYSDPEMQGSKVQLFIKRKAFPEQYNNTISGKTVGIFETIFSSMASARMQEIAMQPDAPFIGGAISSGDVLGIIPSLYVTAAVAATQDGKLAQGFEALYTQMEKIRRYGFTQGELDRAKENLIRLSERNYANRNDRTNESFVKTYLEGYLKNKPIPDAQTEWKIDSMIIGAIDLAMINDFARETITPENQVIVVTAPDKEETETPSEQLLLEIRNRVAAAEIEPYEDNTVEVPLIPEGTRLEGAPVKKKAIDKSYGTIEWTLANGAKVIVKPTTFKSDEVLFNAQAKGGLSILSDEEYGMGELLPACVAMSGVGNFSATDLKKRLSGKAVGVSPSVEEYASVLSGSCSPRDIETLLQLTYLYFTSPRFDRNDYDNLMKILYAQIANAEAMPDYQMQKKTLETIYGHNPRRQMIGKEQLEMCSFDELPGIYRRLFPDANSFRFTFVGNIDPERLKPLVEKYIGSIPASKNPMTFVDDKAYPVKGVVNEVFVTKMRQPKVSVNYTFTGEMDYSIENKLALTYLTQALTARYLVSAREEKGGTYGIQVYGKTAYIPKETYSMTIAFDTNDEMADELCEVVMDELRKIANEGPLTEDIEKTREFLLKDWQSNLEKNGSWMNFIQSKHGSGLDYVADGEQAIRSVSNDAVQRLARKILEDNNIVKVVMRPDPVQEKSELPEAEQPEENPGE